ncbi:hypothetical protein [Moraxella lacunata]|uniref:hypothetical protein n=1 Tax=Moraxella lacunata TaxID=477 RepID=UPI003EDF4F60
MTPPKSKWMSLWKELRRIYKVNLSIKKHCYIGNAFLSPLINHTLLSVLIFKNTNHNPNYSQTNLK